MKKRVLITDSSYKHTLGIVRSFGLLGFEVDLIGEKKSICAYSKFCNQIVYPQSKLTDEYLNDFIEILKYGNYDILIPVSASSVRYVSKNQEYINHFTNVLVPTIDKVNLCLDKSQTFNFFKNKGVNQPETWSFENLDELINKIDEINFPVIVKGKDEINKFPTQYLYNRQQLLRLCATFESSFNSFPLIQEMILGDGYGFFALYHNGKRVQYFMHKRVREFPVNGGSSTCAISVFDNDLLREGTRILDYLSWNGIAMVEFKKCSKTNKFYLIEINPKYWGSLDLAFESGIDFSKSTYDILTRSINWENKIISKYKIGLKYHWPIEGDFFHFLEKPTNFFQIIADTLNFRVKSNIKYYDLLPNLFSIKINFRYKIVIYTLFQGTHFFKFLIRIKSIGLKNAFSRFFSELSGVPLLGHSNLGNSLYIGCQHGKAGKLLLNLLGINSSLNLRHEFDDRSINLEFKNHMYIPIIEYTAPSIDDLNIAVKFIDTEIINGRKVYVHCSEGISRAATIVVAYFIYKGNTIEDSISKLKSVRPFINILPVQNDLLKSFEIKIK